MTTPTDSTPRIPFVEMPAFLRFVITTAGPEDTVDKFYAELADVLESDPANKLAVLAVRASEADDVTDSTTAELYGLFVASGRPGYVDLSKPENVVAVSPDTLDEA